MGRKEFIPNVEIFFIELEEAEAGAEPEVIFERVPLGHYASPEEHEAAIDSWDD